MDRLVDGISQNIRDNLAARKLAQAALVHGLNAAGEGTAGQAGAEGGWLVCLRVVWWDLRRARGG